jgi:hypothetical protein
MSLDRQAANLLCAHHQSWLWFRHLSQVPTRPPANPNSWALSRLAQTDAIRFVGAVSLLIVTCAVFLPLSYQKDSNPMTGRRTMAREMKKEPNMKTEWKVLIVTGTVIALASSQLLAQPWRGGPGRGPGPAHRAGPPNGPGMDLRPDGPRPLGLGGLQGGRGMWRPPGAGPWGRGAWSPLERGQAGTPGLFAHRLGLTDEQRQKIRTIIGENRSKTLALIKEVLTDEQIQQLEQMRGKVRQFDQGVREPGPRDGFDNPMGRRPQRGEGPGNWVSPRGRGGLGQPWGGGQGRGRNPQSQMGPQRPGAPEQPPTNMPGPGAGRGWNRGARPPEQMSDGADANQDGRRPQRSEGPGNQTPRGRGRPGQPFGGGPGKGPDPQSQMGPQQPDTPGQPPANRPGAGQSWNRGNLPLEQIFDEADTNKDGALTKEEIKAFQDARRGNQPFGQ